MQFAGFDSGESKYDDDAFFGKTWQNKPIPNTNMTSSIYACNVTVYVGIGDDLGARSSPTYRRVYASTGSVIRSLESRFLGQKSTH